MPDPIIGRSSAVRKLRTSIPGFAQSVTPLVIIGETGTGKSLLAWHIHSQSPHASPDICSINFGLLNERDQRIALLGGGIPEITTTRKSAMERPTTLLLKHIDHSTLFLQDRLLEAARNKRVTRLGSHESNPVRCRFIFTLRNRPLELLNSGKISRSLFDFLSEQVTVSIPPLRHRRSDIPILAVHLLRKFVDQPGPPGINIQTTAVLNASRKLPKSLETLLLKQRWPENVMGLKAYLRGLIPPTFEQALQEGERRELMKMYLSVEEGDEFSLHQSLSLIQRMIIDRGLERYNRDKSKTAAMLGISDRSVRRNPTSSN